MDITGGTKRKTESESDLRNGSGGKIQKCSEDYCDLNGEDNEAVNESCNAFHPDQTQEYELEDSEGFEINSNSPTSPSHVQENTQEYSMPDSDNNILTERTGNNGDTSKSDPPINKNHDDIEESKSDVKPKMLKIHSVQKDAQLISSIIPETDEKMLYERVLKYRSEKNRVDLVTNEVLENGMSGSDGSSTNVSDSSSDDIFKDVADVLVRCPAANANKVYEMLEQIETNPDRVEIVLNQLIKDGLSCSRSNTSTESSSGPDKDSSSDPFSDPAFKNNPLYRDLKTLRKVLPEQDPAELYAYLEAHFDKGNRVQIVIDELTKSDSQESLPLDTPDSVEKLGKGKQPQIIVDQMQADLQELKEIFPDCDPDYLFEKLEEHPADTERVTKIATSLFENKKYPKLQERLEKEKKQELKKKIGKMELNLEDFLQKFPDPFKFFDDTERQVNKNYQTHTMAFLKNTYPYLKDGYIRKLLENSKQHLSPAVKEIESERFDLIGRASKKFRVTPREEQLEYADETEELFFQEVIFCQNRRKIKDYLAEKKRQRDVKVSTAKESGDLFECGCCFDDECLFEEMGACTDGHIFCKECICRSSEAAIGDGKTKFLCLTGTCEEQFPLQTLQEVLPPKTFSLAIRKMQEEELRQADIPDLVCCPFCSFATVMPDESDKVFKCLNPECLKESCRLCKEPNHVPLRCNEVEKQGETNMRTYIETKMSEAMLRTCPNCKKRFYKDSGCNKMTCTCGTSMCYICREANIDYGHFDQGECQIDSDIFTVHKDEMLKAAEDAKEEYLRDHPEDQDRDLLYDPLKLLEKLQNRYNDNNDDDDDGYDEDEDEGDYDD